jgi:hypothetical protein
VVRAGNPQNKDEAYSSFNEDLNVLYRYSLITIAKDKETCGMHALVQFCTKVWLSSFGYAER